MRAGGAGGRSLREPRRVMITGVTSALGRALAGRLVADSRVAKVLGLSDEERPAGLEGMPPGRFLYQRANLLKPRELSELFREGAFLSQRIDTVVHLAFPHRHELTAGRTHRLNAEGTKRLLDECLRSGRITKFVFRSSGMVYKARAQNPVELAEEDDLNFDADCHPIVKDEVDAELLCRAKMDSPKTRVVVLRPSALVGPSLHTFFNTYLESSVCLQVAGFNPLINLVHVDDMVEAIVLAIHKPVKGIFNVTGTETLPLGDLIRLTGARRLALPESLIPAANALLRRMGLTRFDATVGIDRLKFSCLLDPTKAERRLGYRPSHPVRLR